MGYSSVSKGYRVYVLSTQKIEVSRDVMFEEHKGWNWDTQEEVENLTNTSQSEARLSQRPSDDIQHGNDASQTNGSNTRDERQQVSPIPF